MKIVSAAFDKTELTKTVISVADAVAMNAIPEYWGSLKLAGMQLVALLTLAKLFVLKLDLNQFIQH